MIDGERHGLAEDQAYNTAHKPDKSGFQEKHVADDLHVTTEHLNDADFFGTLVDGHHHGVGNTDGRDKQGHGSDTAEHGLDHVGLLLGLLHPVCVAVRLKAHVSQLFLNFCHMLHIVHVHDTGTVNKIVIRLSFLISRLTRDRLLFKDAL